MESLPINTIDIIFIIVFVISTILGVKNGGLKELLTAASWIGAGFISLYCYDYTFLFVKKYVRINILADLIAILGVFFFALLILTSIVKRFAKVGKKSTVNRTMGFVFGVLRGLVFAAIIYMFFNYMGYFYKDIRTAKSTIVMQSTSKVILALMQPHPIHAIVMIEDHVSDLIKQR